MVRIRAFQARGPGSIPGRRTSAHLAQTVERWPFKPMAVGSIPTVGATSKPIRDGVVGNISACHADARGSIPRRGDKPQAGLV